jgi:hypothetical protein
VARSRSPVPPKSSNHLANAAYVQERRGAHRLNSSAVPLRVRRYSWLQENTMRKSLIAFAALAGAMTIPLAAQAQGTIVVEDSATVGGPSLMIPADQLPRFRQYVVRESVPSYVVDAPIAVGTELPNVGVTYYDVPQQYGTTPYRYTVVNDRTVLVNPRTRRIMQVVE